MEQTLLDSITRLDHWLVAHDYKGYDPFDGLSSPWLRPLTFGSPLLRIALQQGIRRFPWNLRPLAGIKMAPSSKGMGFLARGYLRLHAATGEPGYLKQARFCLDWLLDPDHQGRGYAGACWGNHFDYQSRVFYLPKGVPTIVWVSLIGHALMDAHDQLGERKYLDTAVSACRHIVRDLDRHPDGPDVCLSYIPIDNKQVHNANVLGASLLARVQAAAPDPELADLAERSVRYTVKYQRPDGSWYYGENRNLHWVDNFHTAYVLDSLKYYQDYTGDEAHAQSIQRGYRYWKETFFLADGTPRYYDHQTVPVDIQCCAQAIDTLVFFNDADPQSLELAVKVARWTIGNMQDRDGHFYFRKYANGLTNKTATLHWGQATMMCALAGLYRRLRQPSGEGR